MPAREIALTGSEILACGSSEIIHCVDSEITAGTAVVKRIWQPAGLRHSTAGQSASVSERNISPDGA